MLIKTRVERDVERNIVTQSMEDSFIPPTILVELNRDERIDKTTEKTVWNIMEIRDTSTENMRSDELRTLRDLIHRLDFFIGKEHHPGLEKKRQRLLEEMDEERASVTYTQDRWEHILRFFTKFSKDKKIQLHDLETFIIALEKQESVGQNIKRFSPEFAMAEEHDDDIASADQLLETIPELI